MKLKNISTLAMILAGFLIVADSVYAAVFLYM